jgi:hypothetical protein
MHMTAVPEDHLMCSKFRITSHMEYSDKIRRDRKKLPNCQLDVSSMPGQMDKGG